MCGVGGIFYFSEREVLSHDLEKMNNLMTHRGPNDSGIFQNAEPPQND